MTPRIAKCSVQGCLNDLKEVPSPRSLHLLPTPNNKKLRKRWLEVLNIRNLKFKTFVVCSHHFIKSDFFPRKFFLKQVFFLTYTVDILGRVGQKSLNIKPNSVPSINLPGQNLELIDKRKEAKERRDRRMLLKDNPKVESVQALEVNKNKTVNMSLKPRPLSRKEKQQLHIQENIRKYVQQQQIVRTCTTNELSLAVKIKEEPALEIVDLID